MDLTEWAPSDLSTSPGREKELMVRMEVFLKELSNSRMYHEFRFLLQTSSITEHIRKVLRTKPSSKMNMVVYGIGQFKSCNSGALQISLAILMQRDFKWIGSIEVFDPLLSTVECRILEAIGCSVIYSNERGRRMALEPTLFFMPFCPCELFDNLLLINWNPDLLSNVVIFGNSLHLHRQNRVNPFFPIMFVERFSNEFVMKTHNPRIEFFSTLSWVFFDLDLQFMNSPPRYLFNTKTREIDLQVYPWTEMVMKEKIERYMSCLEGSLFYCNFRHMLQTPPISQHLDMLMMRSKTNKIKLVICDIGSLENSPKSRLQLCLAILMKKHFRWVQDIQIFEPFLSATEGRVFKAFGCTILSLDDYRRSWRALKPTIFFVANSYPIFYSHLLEANWNSNMLNNIIFFGNSPDEFYKRYSHMDLEYSMRYNEAIESFTKVLIFENFFHDLERILLDSDDFEYYWEDFLMGFDHAFRRLYWQIFNPIAEAELLFMNKFLKIGCSVSLLA